MKGDLISTVYQVTFRVTGWLALLFQGLQVSKQTFQDGVGDREHHGRRRRVAEPHGEEGWGHHHSQDEPIGKGFIYVTESVSFLFFCFYYLVIQKGIKRTHFAGCSPTMLRTFRAILRCRPHSSMHDAIKRPLRKRKFVSRKYWMHTFLDGRIPSVGKRQTGSIAVTARGRASVHQKMAISSTT